ncbi:D-alanyl-D-alanine carboxypeptidase [Rhodoligotrophos ferricapiens]|uniref:D-alanyl-D-alanine carboxypeptidase n=1 Tax=Rhodoligotrophos ferricapiens TaxID=3069264 RepID=UPI00315C7AF1
MVLSAFAGARLRRQQPLSRLSTLIPVLVVALLQVMITPASATEKYAGIVVDAATGKILYGRNIDDQRYPASLTKVMTLYILFQELRAGRMTLNTPIVMSKHAASMQPSKLGLKPGRSIRVEDAIRVVVTKSANDVAVAIGEAISGSESAFAERMTRTARALGMSRTQYRNASGLPNPGQVTTARDLATLGLRIQRDFPDYYRYFGISSATVAGKTFRTHNRLIGKYQGTDGIKTGYINASGYNLLASVRRSGKHLVGVVMGGRTAASRNKEMMAILNSGFAKVPARRSYQIAAYAGGSPATQVASVSDTSDHEVTGGSSLAAVAQPSKTALAAAEPKPTANPASGGAPHMTMAALVEATAMTGSTAGMERAAPAGQTQQSTSSSGSDEAKPRSDGSWLIQVGAFPTEASAEKRLAAVRASGIKPLSGKPGFTEMAELGSQRAIYRARFSGFTQKGAQEACRALSRKSIDCLALSPQG